MQRKRSTGRSVPRDCWPRVLDLWYKNADIASWVVGFDLAPLVSTHRHSLYLVKCLSVLITFRFYACDHLQFVEIRQGSFSSWAQKCVERRGPPTPS